MAEELRTWEQHEELVVRALKSLAVRALLRNLAMRALLRKLAVRALLRKLVCEQAS